MPGLSSSYRRGDERGQAPPRAGGPALLRVTLLAPVVALSLGSCGVSAQSDPQPVLRPTSIEVSGAAGASTGVAMTMQVYLLHGDRLQRVERMVVPGPGLAPVLEALSKPVDAIELASGLRTALPVAVKPLRGSITADGTARVAVPAGFDRMSLREQQYAMAQLVFTVTANSLADGVQLLSGDRVVSVPDAMGELRSRPVSRSDYARFNPYP